MHFKQLIVL